MYGKWTISLVFAIVAGVSGCASMSEEECALSDWSAIGYEDGSRGYTSDRFGQHRKACAKHGYAADFGAYQRGRTRGLEEFCRPGHAFTFGVNGGRYNGVCAAELEAGFIEAYQAGYQLYAMRSNVGNANAAIDARQRELRYAKERVTEIGVEIVSSDTTAEERVELLAELKNLSERTGELESEIEQLVAERARAEEELRQYERTVAAYAY